MLNKPNSSEICPPGYYAVKGHERVCHSGARTWVEAHRRRRIRFGAGLLKENLLYLYWQSKKKYPPLKSIAGFKDKGVDFDTAIQFWLEYWKNQDLSFPNIDPLIIKALIAVESRFEPEIHTKSKKSTAHGLMQITSQARRVLAGVSDSKGWQEARSNLISVTEGDISDPVANIGTGIRWLAHKYSKIPKAAEKSIKNMLKNYHSWDEEGAQYAKKILELYNKSR